MPNLFEAIIERDAYSSILYVVLGGLFLLTVFHLAIFFQNRDRTYLLYSSYTFFSLLAYIPVAESGFIATAASMLGIGHHSKVVFTIVFNCIYFFFFTDFLNIKKANIGWYRIIVYPPAVLVLLAFIALGLYSIAGIDVIYDFKNIFIAIITAHTALSFYLLTKLKNNLKHYIVFGGMVLFVCSVIGIQQIRELPWLNLSRKMGDFIYFIGLFVENMAFSLALGHKQKITHDQKIAYQKDLVAELQKNESLKEKINSDNEKRLKVQNEQIKYLQEISDLKLAVLQSQMNPHFIFNALNSIKYCILENDTDKAINYLTNFSKIMRTILIASKMKDFTLSQELHTLQLYVDIENLRFTDIRFDISISTEIDPEEIKLPPLVLQPFIENAILHGIALVEDKRISLQIYPENDLIKIMISDNGIGREKAALLKSSGNTPTKSFGVDIACEMLGNYFKPQPFSVKYTDLYTHGQPAGTQVLITLPRYINPSQIPLDSPKKSLYSQT